MNRVFQRLQELATQDDLLMAHGNTTFRVGDDDLTDVQVRAVGNWAKKQIDEILPPPKKRKTDG